MVENDATSFIWSVFIISSCVFIILLPLAFILCSVCDTCKKGTDLDSNSQRKRKSRMSNISNNSLKIFNETFRRYSLSGEPQVTENYDGGYHQFTSDSLSFYKGYCYSPENDTLVQIEDTKKLNALLKIEQPELSSEVFLDVYETRSYASRLSRNSFYSTYPQDEEYLDQQSPNIELKSTDISS